MLWCGGGNPATLIRLAQEGFSLLLIHWLGGKLRLNALGSKPFNFGLLRWWEHLLARIQPEMRFHQSSTFLMAWGLYLRWERLPGRG